jgi:hypothetical protein
MHQALLVKLIVRRKYPGKPSSRGVPTSAHQKPRDQTHLDDPVNPEISRHRGLGPIRPFQRNPGKGVPNRFMGSSAASHWLERDIQGPNRLGDKTQSSPPTIPSNPSNPFDQIPLQKANG